MTGARERELLYPEPVASPKIKILNKPMHKNANELKLFRNKAEVLMLEITSEYTSAYY